MDSASEDEDEDEKPSIRGLGMGHGPLGLGGNGPYSDGLLGPSDVSVQSISTDSIKTQPDDSDQVSDARGYPFCTRNSMNSMYYFSDRAHWTVMWMVAVIHKRKTKVQMMVPMDQSDAVHGQRSKQNNWMS